MPTRQVELLHHEPQIIGGAALMSNRPIMIRPASPSLDGNTREQGFSTGRVVIGPGAPAQGTWDSQQAWAPD